MNRPPSDQAVANELGVRPLPPPWFLAFGGNHPFIALLQM